MKFAAIFAVVSSLVTVSPAFAAETVTVDPTASLFGFGHCQSIAGEDSYEARIYLHEDFLQGDSYGIMTGELLGLPAWNHFANFITTTPDMNDEGFTLTMKWNGEELGTLKIVGQGVEGVLKLEDVELKCQPLTVPF